MTAPRTIYSAKAPLTLCMLILAVTLAAGCQTGRPDQSQAIAQLSAELEEANQKIEEIYHRVSVVQFMVDNHERTIADLEKGQRPPGPSPAASSDNTGKKAEEQTLLAPDSVVEQPEAVTEETITPTDTKEPQSAEYIYNQGFSALKSKNYTRAISLFKTVVSKYPDHSLADNAIYWTGEIYYTQNDYQEAIRTFNRLIETYPEGGKVPDALLKIGYSYYSLSDKENAVKYLKKVVVEFPFTVPGSKAEAMLNRIE